MALPSHLAKYDALIDLVVEVIVREIEQGVEAKPPATSTKGAGGWVNIEEAKEHGNCRTIARAAASP